MCPCGAFRRERCGASGLGGAQPRRGAGLKRWLLVAVRAAAKYSLSWVEPTRATAEAARAKGIKTVESFFGLGLAEELEPADLVVANNVLAHVPNINDFVAGIARLLKPQGRASIEFPHLLQLLKGNQFDTIYHEHYSYLSLGLYSALL